MYLNILELIPITMIKPYTTQNKDMNAVAIIQQDDTNMLEFIKHFFWTQPFFRHCQRRSDTGNAIMYAHSQCRDAR